MNHLNLTAVSTLLLLCLLAPAGCGKDTPTQPPAVVQTPTRITLSTYAVKLSSAGQTMQIRATVLDQESKVISGAAVTWTSGDTKVATVDANGLVTGVGRGSTLIKAEAGSLSANANVTVASPVVERAVISPEADTLRSIGDRVQLAATAYSGGDVTGGITFTWSSADTAVATVGDNGLVTAVSNGTARITATAGTATAAASITVMQTARAITLTPESVHFAALGDSAQLTAAVLDGRNHPMPHAPVSWTSGDPATARVDAQGLMTAVANGRTRITASSGDVSARTAVTVTQTARGITVTPDDVDLAAIGDTEQLTATVLDGRGEPMPHVAASWTAGDASVATVDEYGFVTAVMNGVTRITASSGSVSAPATVRVMQDVDRIAVTPATATLTALGRTARFTATVVDANGRVHSETSVTWSSNDNSIVTVNENGVVTAVGNGTAQVTASAGGATSGAVATVAQVPSAIAIVPPSGLLTSVGETLQLAATVYDPDGHEISDAEVAWTSGDTGIASVSEDGLVTAVFHRTVLIRAALDNASAESVITITEPPRPVRMAIAPPSAVLTAVGETVQLTATVYDQYDQSMPDAEVTWSSNADSVATVNETGLVTAVGNGSTRITAVSDSLSAIAGITVELPHMDREALIALYHSTDGPNWFQSDNWLSDEPLEDWYGVRADEDGRVLGLTLRHNRLTGPIPPEFGLLTKLETLNFESNALTGPIPPEFGQLEALTLLVLSNNPFTGGSLPGTLGGLKSLRDMVVINTGLSGDIPPGIGQLTRLVRLTMKGNSSLNGTIPSEIGGAGNLEFIDLSGNALSGSIPSGIGRLSRVEELNLENNRLTGSIPNSIGGMTSVTEVQLTNNRLTGPIPPGIRGMSKLYGLWAQNNQLSGSLPSELGQVPNLEILDLRNNRLTGTIPAGVGNAPKLRWLDLGGNSGMRGRLPTQLTRLKMFLFLVNGTRLCAPSGSGFQDWLRTIQHRAAVPDCESVASVTVTPDRHVFREIGATLQLRARVLNYLGEAVPGAKISWSSPVPGTVTVSDNGLVTAVMASVGAIRIEALAGRKSGVSWITVAPAGELWRAVITPSAPRLANIGDTVQLTVRAYDRLDSLVTGYNTLWLSTETSVATVSQTGGLVTAAGIGTARIIAFLEKGDQNDQKYVDVVVGSTSGQAELNQSSAVTSAIDERIPVTVSQQASGMTTWQYSFDERRTPRVGETFRLVFTFKDINGNSLPDDTQVIYHGTSDSTIATVTSGGDITALKAGKVDIEYEVPAWSPDGEISKASITIGK